MTLELVGCASKDFLDLIFSSNLLHHLPPPFPFLSTPESGPFDANKRWTGKDVIMTLKDGHFTLLNPAYGDERNSKPWSDYPVDDLMAAIEEYNTGTH